MKEIHPPRLAQKFFDWACNDAFVEDMRGDIDELFYANTKRMTPVRAKLKYWLQVLSLITSYALKKRKPSSQYFTSNGNSMDMLRSYFIIASRSLAKHKFFTVINVLGLAVGMSISLLFIAMVTFVATYDDFHAHGDRIYRIISKTNLRDKEFARTPLPLAERLSHEYPGIEKVIRIDNNASGEAEFNNKQIPMEGFFVDADFLNVFSFPMKNGNASSALAKPSNLVITEAGAKRMFGSEEPVGKVIKLEKYGEFEITGLLKNPPKNSHLQFEILVPFQALENFERTQGFVSTEKRWANLNMYTYLLMPNGFSEDDLNGLTTFANKIAKTVYPKEESEFKATFKLQSLDDIAPGPDLAWEIGPVWDVPSFIFFGVLTLLILLPACFNYTNISISRALKRSKEIGLRKVVGGQRQQIFFQFILETVIVTLLALGLSFVIFTATRGEFTSMIVASEFLDLTPKTNTIFYFVGFAILVGLVAGAVPAIYFSKLNPVQALKSKSSSKASTGSFLRKSLVVVQFALSLGFIMAVAITAKQHVATLNYNFGFTKENILDIDLQGVDPNIFRNEFSKLSSIQTISMSSGVMGASMPMGAWIQKPEKKDSVEVMQMAVDANYLANLNLKLVAGKSFPDQPETREQFVIVNETFLKKLGISNAVEALDKSYTFPDAGELRILGVVKDFHYLDLRMPIESFVFRHDQGKFNYANMKIMSTDMQATFSEMERAWKSIAGERKFEARFFDDEIEEAYSIYYSMIKMSGFLGMLAITISCLGLLGMVVYATETRTKEIGVRKVMGASTRTIAVILSKDYVKLMLIAVVIATPLTYLFFDLLLFGSEQYPIGIGALEIVASILLMLILGVSTVLSQTVKAAKANPVDTLRYE